MIDNASISIPPPFESLMVLHYQLRLINQRSPFVPDRFQIPTAWAFVMIAVLVMSIGCPTASVATPNLPNKKGFQL
jgi:hypothetical protein